MGVDNGLNRVLKGRGVSAGYGGGNILVTEQPFMFAHGIDPETGNVIDVRSDLLGRNIKGKVLIFPSGKGSTTGSAWLLEVIRRGNGPAAIINRDTEPIIATALIMADLLYGVAIPLVDGLDTDVFSLSLKESTVQVNGTTGEVTLTGAES
jgi:uncharacterized protein